MKELTVDIDTLYENFVDSGMFGVLKCRIQTNVKYVDGRYIRKSAHGRVHLKLTFDVDVSLFESVLIRAYLDDDPARLARDLSRYFITQKIESTGRCFDVKCVDGVVAEAGEWRKF